MIDVPSGQFETKDEKTLHGVQSVPSKLDLAGLPTAEAKFEAQSLWSILAKRPNPLLDLRRSKPVTWASWNFNGGG